MTLRTSGPAKVILKYAPNEWQVVEAASSRFSDEPGTRQDAASTGYVMPWFSDRFLRELIDWPMEAWRVLEFGAGYSTLWWASRCRQVLSLEHDPDWIGPVNAALAASGLANARVQLLDWGTETQEGEAWSRNPDSRLLSPGYFDLVVVDGGGDRLECLAWGLAHVKDGGALILDNSDEHAPGALQATSGPLAALRFNERHDYPMTGHPSCVTTYWRITERRTQMPPVEQWRVPSEHPEMLVMRRQS